MADCQPASILVDAALVLAVVGAAAGWVPAYRASRINPAGVLGIART
jgi:ABC-type antimicrobial peptide transport system permease subunit